MMARLVLILCWVMVQPVFAQDAAPLRVATYNAGLHRKGPGLLLRDIRGGTDARINAALNALVALDADVLVLSNFDYDYGLVALTQFAEALGKAGAPYPYRFALRPNTGMATGLDMDGDGRKGGPADAQGFGFFAGAGGLAILSRLPVDTANIRDFSSFLWQDLPGNLIENSLPPKVKAVQRLSSTAHWDIPLITPQMGRLHLLVWHATPPVFDGPEDRNGRRNHDEAAFWLRMLEGRLPFPAPDAPFVLIGNANLDPADGDGRTGAIRALLAHPRLQDPAPKGLHNRVEPAHQGNPALDTALFDSPVFDGPVFDGPVFDGPGGLRVDYVLPSADLAVKGAGVLWPDEADPLAATLAQASRHRPVWVDIELP